MNTDVPEPAPNRGVAPVQPVDLAALLGARLAGRVVLVTGASRHLGADIARVMAEAGAVVAVNHRSSPEQADAVLAGLPGSGHLLARGDVSTEDGVDAVVGRVEETTGAHVAVLVNNAGPFSLTSFGMMPPEEFDMIFAGNVRSAYLVTRRVAPAMRACGWGRIVNLSAGSAYCRNHSIYSLAKDAVITLTESLALELGPGVTVNCVAPGQIAESAEEMSVIDPEFAPRLLARTPAGRLVTRREVAQMVAICCSPAFDLVTGVTIPLDGGARIPVA